MPHAVTFMQQHTMIFRISAAHRIGTTLRDGGTGIFHQLTAYVVVLVGGIGIMPIMLTKQ